MKLVIWTAAVVVFVVIAQVARIWVPEHVALALGLAAQGLMLKPVMETPEHPISFTRHAVVVGVATVIGVVIWLLWNALIGG